MSDSMSQGQPPADTAPPSTADQAQALLAAAQDQPAPEPTPVAPVPDPQAPPAAPAPPSLSDFAQGVLKDIPDADREIVAKYLPKWDAGVTRRFQEVQSTYAPIAPILEEGYEADDIQTAMQLYGLLETDPAAAFELLQRVTGYQAGPGPGQQQAPQFGEVGYTGDPEYGQPPQLQLPPELSQQLQNINAFMEQQALAQQQAQQLAQQAEEDAQLAEYLGLLKTEKGDFDEMFVLQRMGAGVPGDQAVDEYNSWKQAQLDQFVQTNGPAQSAPPVLHGGSAPVGTKPVTEASDQERKALVAEMLHQANSSGS